MGKESNLAQSICHLASIQLSHGEGGWKSLTKADQNTGVAHLEFSMRTAMQGTSCRSSAIFGWNN